MLSANPDCLVMVYNAEEGLVNSLNDWAHKFFSPATYVCPLCYFTYGVAGMRAPWKTFIEHLPFPTVFIYRPDFWKSHPQFREVVFPLILVEKAGNLAVVVSAEEI